MLRYLASAKAQTVLTFTGMGLLRNALFGVPATVFITYCYCGMRHINGVVKQINVPQSTLLSRHFRNSRTSRPDQRHFADAYKIDLPKRFELLKNTPDEFDVNQYATIFFSSPIFRIQKVVLKIIRGVPEPDLSQFIIGQKIYVWKVVDRNKREILLSWQDGKVAGYTWFFVRPDENVIIFGSSIETPRLLGADNQPHKTSSDDGAFAVISDTMSSAFAPFTKPNVDGETKSFGENIRIAVDILSWPILVTFHRYYSKILLYCVLRKLSTESS